jgi:hypothetical protein
MGGRNVAGGRPLCASFVPQALVSSTPGPPAVGRVHRKMSREKEIWYETRMNRKNYLVII